MCVLVSLLAVSCADSAGPVEVDAQWSLTCPDDVGCTTPAKTCLGEGNQRTIVGQHGQQTCTDDPLIASCEAVERDGARLVFLEVNVGDAFAFELRGARIDAGGPEQAVCTVTIVEDGDAYGRMLGACGEDPPSMVQPCQLSEISAAGGEVSFDLECDALLSTTTGFDVRGTFRFSNCTGL